MNKDKDKLIKQRKELISLYNNRHGASKEEKVNSIKIKNPEITCI
jgi:hypothetical protein